MITSEFIDSKMNTIIHGNCLDIMKQIPDNFFDLVLTDPPYGTTQNKWDIVIDLKEFWEQINRITNDNSAVICFSAQPFTTDLINSNRSNFRYSLVWDKVLPVGFLNANRMPLRRHEDICIFYRKLPFYNPEKTTGHNRKIVKNRNSKNNKNYGEFKKNIGVYDSTERFPTSILQHSNGGTRSKIVHPTQKPEELVTQLLRLYAKKGFKIYEPFSGSGTIPVCCEMLQHLELSWVASELEEDYVAIANKRLEAVQGSLF
jgi:site-specific DNA-methyltransferase (adenine-specific)